jgi:hypothetical protein
VIVIHGLQKKIPSEERQSGITKTSEGRKSHRVKGNISHRREEGHMECADPCQRTDIPGERTWRSIEYKSSEVERRRDLNRRSRGARATRTVVLGGNNYGRKRVHKGEELPKI